MVVHPAAGHAHGTLVNAALAHAPEMEGIGGEQRPGVVHRLDKDTSGLILMAKMTERTTGCRTSFATAVSTKFTWRLWMGVHRPLRGALKPPSVATAHIANRWQFNPRIRVASPYPNTAAPRLYPEHTPLEVHPLTGRTHQIRLHLAFLGCPIVGDKVYGRKKPTLPIDRQFLHAARLTIKLPGRINR